MFLSLIVRSVRVKIVTHWTKRAKIGTEMGMDIVINFYLGPGKKSDR